MGLFDEHRHYGLDLNRNRYYLIFRHGIVIHILLTTTFVVEAVFSLDCIIILFYKFLNFGQGYQLFAFHFSLAVCTKYDLGTNLIVRRSYELYQQLKVINTLQIPISIEYMAGLTTVHYLIVRYCQGAILKLYLAGNDGDAIIHRCKNGNIA